MLRRRILFTNLFLYSFFLFVVVVLAFGAAVYYNAALSMKARLGESCAGLAGAAAVLLEEDIAGYRDFAARPDKNGDYYQALRPKLDKMRRSRSAAGYLLTQQKISAAEIIYVLDAAPESGLRTGAPEQMSPSEEQAYRLGAPYHAGDFAAGPYGLNISGYAPILDPRNGELVGLVEAGISIDEYNSAMHNLRFTLVTGAVVMVLFALLVTILSSGRVGKLIILDHLTGTFNKSHFLKSFHYHAEQSRKKGSPLTLLMTDLDHFKRVNDTYGHPFGDIMLTKIAATIACALRKTDYLSRYGGEEFACFLPGMTQAEAVRVAQRIREAVAHTRVYNDDREEEVGMTISIGVAQLLPDETPEAAISRADKALYRAKNTRNSVIVCAQSDAAPTPES